MKIYTKTGDKGQTGYIGGRVRKDDALIHMLGELDELNSTLGICVVHAADLPVQDKLVRTQTQVFSVSASVAGSRDTFDFGDWVNLLESEIDEIELELSGLKNFILPGGDVLAAYLHHARSVCRRSERRLVELSSVNRDSGIALPYLNRLSDWLFVMARWTNHMQGVEDRKWTTGSGQANRRLPPKAGRRRPE